MQIERKYCLLEKIGEGTYGKVFKGIDLRTGTVIAFKQIPINKNNDGLPYSSIREASILKFLNHPNIIKIHEVIESHKFLYIVIEYVDQDLSRFIETNKEGQNNGLIKSFIFQLLHGILHCHNNNIIHRDLKPQNLLITRFFELKIADFGLSRASNFNNDFFSHEVVTLWYRAPDLLMGSNKYSKSVDIWSAGCIFAEMILMKPLFKGKDLQNQLDVIFQTIGTPTNWPEMISLAAAKNLKILKSDGISFEKLFNGFDKDGIDLIKKMLECNPDKRISCKDALSHKYFKSIKN